MLWKQEKKTRHDIGRPALTQKIWDWKEFYHANITNQLKRLGGSLDWSREAYTMDDNLSAAVRDTFIQLREDGVIYRANRLVNWCSALGTSLSNLEVENVELEGRTLLSVPGYEKKMEFGVLTTFDYEVEGGKKIPVATTRPETMLGDTGIAVHPDDARYKELVGSKARHPFLDRSLIIFADEHVDPEFGTGAVKITPAHDPNDFALGKKHNLPFINIFNDNGTLNANAGKFIGMRRFDARYEVINQLKDRGLYVKWENNKMKVPLCSKSKDVIEPIMKPQWWMKMDSLAKPAIEVVKNGTIKIRPESAEKNYLIWMEGIQDWCLSRQLWWGHQAPAYFVSIEGEEGDRADDAFWVTAKTPEEAQSKAAEKFPNARFKIERDEDVLDTWFSSGLWPFSTLGWPKKTKDMADFYPTSMLETGWDIIFFWVARMIMFGLKMTGKVPFHEVYCHSLIRDSEGRKMSKSLGNVVDPLDIIDGINLEDLHAKLLAGNLDPKEVDRAKAYQKSAFPGGIAQCGADALRFALVNYTTGGKLLLSHLTVTVTDLPGGDIAFDIKVIESYRRFCNKIYQATNFALGRLGGTFQPLASASDTRPSSMAEQWILHQLNNTAKEVNQAINDREFSNSAQALYQYWLFNFCDIFIEYSKAGFESTDEKQEPLRQTLYTALEGGLLLLHPIMPFITEYLWQKLPRRQGDNTKSIMTSSYPQYNPRFDNPKHAENYKFITSIAEGERSLLSRYGFKEPGDLFVQTLDEKSYAIAKEQQTSIKALGLKYTGKVEVLPPSNKEPPPGCAVYPVSAQAKVYLHVAGKIDLDKEIAKAKASIAAAEEKVRKSEKVMSASGWDKVKAETKENEARKMRDAKAEVGGYEKVLKDLERLKMES